MTPLPLLVAAIVLAADAAPLAPPPESAPAPLPPLEPAPTVTAPAPTRSPDRAVSAAAGMNVMKFDGVPVLLGTVRGAFTALQSPDASGSARWGVALVMEAVAGETENGLQVGGVTLGPHLVMETGILRASGGVELGTYGVTRATLRGGTGYLATGFFRGEVQAQVWSTPTATFFLAATGSFGGGNDIPFRGWGGFLGLRF